MRPSRLPARLARGAAGALALAAARALAAQAAPAADGAPAAPPQAVRRALTRFVVGGRFEDPALRESSGLAASGRVPGLLWTLNDSGHEPELFAVDAEARVLGRVRVAGAKNRDWEAIAVGPCGGVPDGCLYVGDVGDNEADARRKREGDDGRRRITIYRVPEPRGALAGPLPAARARGAVTLPAETAPAVALDVRYPDGPHDVESMTVFPDGAVWLITKQVHRRADGTPRPVLVYEVPGAAWAGAGARARKGEERPAPATARLVDSLPILPDGSLFHRVTDAALDLPRRLLAVRTYQALYLVPLAPAPGGGWRVARAPASTLCEVTALREPQGEGLAVIPGGGGALALSSESNVLGPGGLSSVSCPAPR